MGGAEVTWNTETSEVAPMVTAQAFVFDAYGTLFDVHSVVRALKAITTEAEALSRLWRTKQLEYTWLRSLMGRYVDFWTVTDEALRFALTHYGLQLAPEQHATLLKAYLELAAYPEIPALRAGTRGFGASQGGHRLCLVKLLRRHGSQSVWVSGGMDQAHANASR